MRLTITRHGETVENKQGILQGQRHGRLSTLGKEQAKLLAKRLSTEHFDIIYSSDLRRAKQTTREIIRYHPTTKVVYTAQLRERLFGPLQGKNHTIINFAHEEKKGVLSGKTKAETLSQFAKRIAQFLEETRKKHEGEKVLFVAHGGVKLGVYNCIKQEPTKDFFKLGSSFGNTSVTIVSFKGKKHRFHKIGCTKHLRS